MTAKKLTLRTLLAYLDDTLAPADAKAIGEKVKENKVAQEMIERIKKLIRKRRLTTPPLTGPEARFDANTIAEYLDNELDKEEVHDLEEFCREANLPADLYLAEVASVHQILTLVLGEPMTVPTTAKQRMYSLVKGRESNPTRKPVASPQTTKLAGSHADMDLGETSPLLGLTPRKKPWLVWAIPAIAAALLVGVGLALYLALPHLTDEPTRPRDLNQVTAVDPNKQPDKPRDDARPKDNEPMKEPVKEPMMKEPVTPEPMKEPMMKEPMMKEPVVPNPPMPQPVFEAPGEISNVKSDVATYSFDKGNATILLQKKEKGWTRLPINAKVSSVEPLVALPGSACAIKTNGGANILLRGFLPQYRLPGIEVMSRLLESSVTLHHNSKVAADLTLHRGRIQIANDIQPVTVIVRFWKETWILRLTEPNSEVGIDLVSKYTGQTNFTDGEEPQVDAFLLVTKGKIDLRVDTFEYPNLSAPPGPALYAWNNKGARMLAPLPVPVQSLAVWAKELPPGEASKTMHQAVQELAKQTTGMKSVNTVLKEMRLSQNTGERLLAIYSLGAVDQISDLVDALSDEDEKLALERDEAAFTLRRWINRDAKHNLDLYNTKAETGVLLDKGFKKTESEILVSLLHGFINPTDQAEDVKTKLGLLLRYMQHDRAAVRHMAHYILDTTTRGVMGKPEYNAGMSPEARKTSVAKLQEMLDGGALMPMAPRIGPMPPKP